jgi:hypothetical protein
MPEKADSQPKTSGERISRREGLELGAASAVTSLLSLSALAVRPRWWIFYSLARRRCYARHDVDRPAGRHAGLHSRFHVPSEQRGCRNRSA